MVFMNKVFGAALAASFSSTALGSPVIPIEKEKEENHLEARAQQTITVLPLNLPGMESVIRKVESGINTITGPAAPVSTSHREVKTVYVTANGNGQLAKQSQRKRSVDLDDQNRASRMDVVNSILAKRDNEILEKKYANNNIVEPIMHMNLAESLHHEHSVDAPAQPVITEPPKPIDGNLDNLATIIGKVPENVEQIFSEMSNFWVQMNDGNLVNVQPEAGQANEQKDAQNNKSFKLNALAEGQNGKVHHDFSVVLASGQTITVYPMQIPDDRFITKVESRLNTITGPAKPGATRNAAIKRNVAEQDLPNDENIIYLEPEEIFDFVLKNSERMQHVKRDYDETKLKAYLRPLVDYTYKQGMAVPASFKDSKGNFDSHAAAVHIAKEIERGQTMMQAAGHILSPDSRAMFSAMLEAADQFSNYIPPDVDSKGHDHAAAAEPNDQAAAATASNFKEQTSATTSSKGQTSAASAVKSQVDSKQKRNELLDNLEAGVGLPNLDARDGPDSDKADLSHLDKRALVLGELGADLLKNMKPENIPSYNEFKQRIMNAFDQGTGFELSKRDFSFDGFVKNIEPFIQLSHAQFSDFVKTNSEADGKFNADRATANLAHFANLALPLLKQSGVLSNIPSFEVVGSEKEEMKNKLVDISGDAHTDTVLSSFLKFAKA